MTTDDTRRRPLQGQVDFTFMYAAHDAFRRDLRRLAGAVETRRTAEPAVRAGWATFKNQLHVHHTAEDDLLWPALRAKVTQPGDVAVLDAMHAEHARLDPLLDGVDASLAATDSAALVENTGMLAETLAAHMEHEEDQALPLIEAHLGPPAGRRSGRRQGRVRACAAAPSCSPGCSTAPRPAPASGCSACCRHPPGSSTGRYGVPATAAPRAGPPP